MAGSEWAAAGIAALVTIATASCGLAWTLRQARGQRRSEVMEDYLRCEREGGDQRGQRSVRHLMETLGMTEVQVLDASRRSPAIKRLATTALAADALSADATMFEYAPLGSQGRDAA